MFADHFHISLDQFIQQSKTLHEDNFDYSLVEFIKINDYTEPYLHKSSYRLISIICNKHDHGVFRCTIKQHLKDPNGHCPVCNKKFEQPKSIPIKPAKPIKQPYQPVKIIINPSICIEQNKDLQQKIKELKESIQIKTKRLKDLTFISQLILKAYKKYKKRYIYPTIFQIYENDLQNNLHNLPVYCKKHPKEILETVNLLEHATKKHIIKCQLCKMEKIKQNEIRKNHQKIKDKIKFEKLKNAKLFLKQQKIIKKYVKMKTAAKTYTSINISNGVKSSKGELTISNYLNKHNITFIKEYKFDDCINERTKRKLRFDFYLPNNNICIEFDGPQHFKESIGQIMHHCCGHILTEQEYQGIYLRDNIKNDYCLKNNIKLIRIPFTYNIEDTLNLLFK